VEIHARSFWRTTRQVKAAKIERNFPGYCRLKESGEVFVRRKGMILAMITKVFQRFADD